MYAYFYYISQRITMYWFRATLNVQIDLLKFSIITYQL